MRELTARLPGGRATRREQFAVAGALMILTLLVAACSSTPTSTVPTGALPSGSSTSAEACPLGDKAVPSCGLLWGLATRPATLKAVMAIEEKIGRQVDLVYRYHDLSKPLPDEQERKIVASGRLLHVSLATRVFSAGSTGPDSRHTWAAVAKGNFDDILRKDAQGVASLKVPVFVTFEQEASQKAKIARLGPPADFVSAWRHIHELFAAEGVTNAVWTWVMTGSADNLGNAARLWPGNDYVDWISWNVYNQSGCKSGTISADQFVSFEDRMTIFYTFVHTRGPSLGMDPTKPMMISETGSVRYPDDPERTASWYASIPATLARYPQIKAVTLWASIDAEDRVCNYRFDEDAMVSSGVRQAVTEGAVNTARAAIPTP